MLVVDTKKVPDKNGLILMNYPDEYDEAITWGCKGDRYLDDYEVTSLGNRAVLHPVTIPFDDSRVEELLGV